MKQELINLALEIVTEREKHANEIADTNKRKALENKEFACAYTSFMDKMISYAKGETKKQEVDDAQKIVNEKLELLGIGSIIPAYSCKKCNDSGFVDGKYCECLKKEISKILVEKSGFSHLNDFSSSNFDIFSSPNEIQKIYVLMQKWCQVESDKKLVYLLGNTGTGKTYLTSCMANEFIKQGRIVQMTTAFNLSQDFLKFHRSFTDKEKQEVFETYLTSEILFIDDLGTEPIYNNVSREYLYLLINERKIKNLRTVITSNLEPIDLREKYDERIFSRIMDKSQSIVLKLDSKDVRLKK